MFDIVIYSSSNMNGLLVRNTNQWSCQSLTGQQSGNPHHGPLILGAWVSLPLFPSVGTVDVFIVCYIKWFDEQSLAIVLPHW